MLSIFLVTHIFWVINISKISECNFASNIPVNAEACYVNDSQNIYISEKTITPRDFVFYHELGHHLMRKIYPKNLFNDEEIMSDQFALYIYNQKYPAIKPSVVKERAEFFKGYCNQDCVKEIINVKVPNMVYPIKPFNVRI